MIVSNLAIAFGTLAETVELVLAIAMMIGGIYLTHRIQVWADRAGQHPGAVNTGLGGAAERIEDRSIRR